MAPLRKIVNNKSAGCKIIAGCTYVFELQKRLRGVGLKKRAPKAIQALKEFATLKFNTADVRIDPDLNKHIWCQGRRCFIDFDMIYLFCAVKKYIHQLLADR